VVAHLLTSPPLAAAPRECPALDYACHTVDGAAALLCDETAFPSRVVVSRTAAANFPNLARRLYRCLSHAWKHHPAVYAAYEVRVGPADCV
jgi:hypothetical protein